MSRKQIFKTFYWKAVCKARIIRRIRKMQKKEQNEIYFFTNCDQFRVI